MGHNVESYLRIETVRLHDLFTMSTFLQPIYRLVSMCLFKETMHAWFITAFASHNIGFLIGLNNTDLHHDFL